MKGAGALCFCPFSFVSALFFYSRQAQRNAMRRFQSFACVDWSGALGERLPGIAVAQIKQSGPPALINPKSIWSRQAVLDWFNQLADEQSDILIGLDLSLGFPFVDKGCYFPHWSDSPHNAKSLWALVDRICSPDPHLSATSFLTHAQGHRHFRHAKGKVGDLFKGGLGRLRVVETYQRATKQANSWSCFNLVGAGQVGKSSLTGMRMMHSLGGRIPVWPFDPIPQSGPVIIEIYTSMAARAAGLPANRSKIRDRHGLVSALNALGSKAPSRLSRYDDHATDALITAAWMRGAAENDKYWNPKALLNDFRSQEGWTFGVV
jgi:hypothetical protein